MSFLKTNLCGIVFPLCHSESLGGAGNALWNNSHAMMMDSCEKNMCAIALVFILTSYTALATDASQPRNILFAILL